jgi:hypothetical protein
VIAPCKMMATAKPPMFIRVAPEIKEATEAAALREFRSVSNYVEMVLRERLRRDGFLPAKEKETKK